MVFKGYDDLVQGAGLVQSSVLASGKAGSVLGQFNSLFQGLTVSCSGRTLDSLAALPGVLAIVPDAIITLDETQDVSQVRDFPLVVRRCITVHVPAWAARACVSRH